MAINLWKTGGQPTAYNPLPYLSNTATIILGIGDYVVRFNAKSATNGVINLYKSSEWDNYINLTPTSKSYMVNITVKTAGNVYFIDKNDNADIIIDSIELVQKPLSKLTINGIDGFKSGKWTLHANASVVDDETLVLNATADWSASRLDVPVLPNTTYTLTREVISGVMYIDSYDKNNVKISNLVATSLLNSTFTTPSNCSYVKVLFDNGTGRGTFTFKRPMLNVGTIPAPYNKKTSADAKMVMPVPVKNIIPSNIGLNSGYYFDGSGGPSTANSGFIRLDSIPCKPNTTYALSSNLGIYTVWCFGGSTAIIKSANGGPGTYSLSFTTPNGCDSLRISLYNTSGQADTVAYKWAQAEEGTTATPYKPYAVQVNAKPKRYVPKKNLFDGVLEKGKAYLFASGNDYTGTDYNRSKNPMRVTAGKVITLSSSYSFNSVNTGFIFYNANMQYISGSAGVSQTVPSGAVYAHLNLYGTNISSATIDWVQIEEGTTATTYEPYQLILPRAKTGLSFEPTRGDYLQLPSMTMDSIEIDCLVPSGQSNAFIVDARTGLTNGHLYCNDITDIRGSGFTQMLVDGVLATSFPKNQRTKIKLNASSVFTDNVNIFSYNDSTGKAKGTLYKVTCYLAGTIVAQYDFENPGNIVGDKVLSIADYNGPKKNLIPTGAFAKSTNLIYTPTYIKVTPNTQYTFSVASGYRIGVNSRRSDGSLSSWNGYNSGSLTLTTASDVTQLELFVQNLAGTNIEVSEVATALPQLELGSAATTYEPYQLITIKRDTKNLIPSFEDSRWGFHTNTQLLGKDYLRLNATGSSQSSVLFFDALPNTSYLGFCSILQTASDGIMDIYSVDSNNVNTWLQGCTKANPLRVITTPSSCKKIRISCSSNIAGTFDFIKPQIYQLDSKEGTIVGSPAKLEKPSKRKLYRKR